MSAAVPSTISRTAANKHLAAAAAADEPQQRPNSNASDGQNGGDNDSSLKDRPCSGSGQRLATFRAGHAYEKEDGDDGEVLKQEDTERRAPGPGAKTPCLSQTLHDERGG
ncbi:hypothetical protein GCM10011371_28790 [Novosphingobium marinum]|nr:hypothetical protein GCM10011371_28790 [Novosphingobium marinum]